MFPENKVYNSLLRENSAILGSFLKKLVPFLNDMVECNILETTGASWRFRHRILQDYFADQWVETEFDPEQK